jgi:phosphatidylglycerophosphate synthase
MIGESWTHRIARPLLRPLLGTWVRPNHLTTLRLLSGLAACGCFALGTRAGMNWGGWLWLVSSFLDRADGELARMGNLGTPGGHLYDYFVDGLINTVFFVAIGFGLRSSWFGGWSILLGLISGAAILACILFAEWLERRSAPGERAVEGKWGFDPDDALYLMAPLAWLGWLNPVLIGAAIATPVIAVLLGVRLLRLRRG